MVDLVNPLALNEPEEIEEAVIRADDVPGAAQGAWTYAAYAAIPDDGKRYEIIEGVLYQMPSPQEPHQSALSLIFFYLMLHVQMAGAGKVYVAPFDVKLFKNTTVQPDIIVVLNPNKKVITKKNIKGAPDLVVEISSPGTASYDRTKKRQAYARAGVKEFWIVRPATQSVEVFGLEEGELVLKGSYQAAALVESNVLADFPIKAEQFFA